MKKFYTLTGIMAVVAAAFFAVSTVKADNKDDMRRAKFETDGPAPHMKLEVTPSGRGILRGDLVSVSGNTLKVKSWGGEWTVVVSSSTELLRRFDGRASLDEFLAGDRIGVAGRFATSSQTIDATVVKDWSIQKRHATFRGTISNLTSNSFTLTARQKVDGENRDARGTTTILVNLVPETKIEVKNASSTASTTLQNGMIAKVRGIWNRAQNTLLADWIKARLPGTDEDDD